MCHDTTGIAAADAALSLQLAGHAVRLALTTASADDWEDSGKASFMNKLSQQNCLSRTVMCFVTYADAMR